MGTNIHDKKIKRQKRCKNSREIAYVCDCHVRMVNYVLSGNRGNKRVTELAEKIQLAAQMLEEKNRLALEEVRGIVNYEL